MSDNKSKSNLGCIIAVVLGLIVAYVGLQLSSIVQHMRFYNDAETIVNEYVLPIRHEVMNDHATFII